MTEQFTYLNGKQVLVAGGGGFIGGHLVRRLRDFGVVSIRAVDRNHSTIGTTPLPTPRTYRTTYRGRTPLSCLERKYDDRAPQGVRGRNSDNARVVKMLAWEPTVPLSERLPPTFHWIENQMAARVRD